MPLNLIPTSPSKALAIIAACHEQGETVMLHGHRGVGKSSIVKQHAEQIHGELWTLMLPQIEFYDIRGLTALDMERNLTRWLPPEFLPRTPGPGVLFLDELTAADHRTQKAGYQLLLDRRVGAYRVPDGWLVAAAGNTGADGALVNAMDAPAADRMVHVLVTATIQDWIAWAQGAGISQEIIAYLHSRPDHLDGTEEQVAGDKLLGPSPRGWARVDKFLKTMRDRHLLELTVTGIVGEGVAASFLMVLDQLRTQASIEEICTSSRTRRRELLPTTLVGLYNLCYGLAAWATGAQPLGQALEVVASLKELTSETIPAAEIQTLAMELLLAKAESLKLLPHIIRTPMYREYRAQRQALGLAS